MMRFVGLYSKFSMALRAQCRTPEPMNLPRFSTSSPNCRLFGSWCAKRFSPPSGQASNSVLTVSPDTSCQRVSYGNCGISSNMTMKWNPGCGYDRSMASAVLHREAFVREHERLDRRLVAGRVERGGGDLRRPGVLDLPRHDRVVLFVEQLD